MIRILGSPSRWPWLPAAEFFDLLDVGPGALVQFLGQCLYVIGTTPGIDDFADAGFVLKIELGVPGDVRGKVGGERCI